MKAHVYIEGGGASKEEHIRCREGFRKLIEQMGFLRKMPRLTACGGRGSVFNDFKTAHVNRKPDDYIAMLVDSEDPVGNLNETWAHLMIRDNLDKPPGAEDEQILFMTTSMETWIVADRATLQKHYGHCLQESALPPEDNLENRNRHEVHSQLAHATRNCSNAYSKGNRSFEVLAKLHPEVLRQLLPSFDRVIRILNARLEGHAN